VYLALTLFSAHPAGSFRLFGNFFIAALVLWAGLNLMRDPRIARAAIVSFVLGCASLALCELAGIGVTMVDPTDPRHRVFGQDPNFVAGHMGLAIICSVAILASARRPRVAAVPAIAGAALLGHSLLGAASRGAFAGTAVGFFAFAVAGWRPHAARRHVSLALLAVAALVWAGSTVESARTRVEAALTTGNLSGRERIYPEAWRMVVERPLVGWGPTDARYELRLRTAAGEPEAVRRSPLERDAHNLVLEALMTTGLAGTLPLLGCIALSVHAAWRGRAGPYGAAPFALIAGVLALGMSSTWSMSKEAWLFFGYGLASGDHGLRR
jgi:O-antigen ligase